jgi:FkbM family methyltransferase
MNWKQRLRRSYIYHRLRASPVYRLYWRVVDRTIYDIRMHEIRFFREVLRGIKKGATIFDIGANTGECTFAFLKLGARVVAVDPDPHNQRVLTGEFLSYRLRKKPVTVVAKAVSDRNGHATFLMSGPGFDMNTLNQKWAESLTRDPGRFGRTFSFNEQREVETTSLDALIQTYGKPFYIKIDVEGAEADAIRGLTSVVPYLSFEVNLPEFRAEGLTSIARLHEISPTGVFNYAAGHHSGLLLNDWVRCEEFVPVVETVSENSIEVFWRNL